MAAVASDFAEYRVICDFLTTSGVLECFDTDSRELCNTLVLPFFYVWYMHEALSCTIRNFGHHCHRLFSTDESFLDASETALAEYYATDPKVLDPRHVARTECTFPRPNCMRVPFAFGLALPLYAEYVNITKNMSYARLDDAERAVLVLILLTRAVQKLVGAKRSPLAAMLNAVFRDLKEHYERTYEDFALRLDRVVYLADEFQRLQCMFDEHVVILQLCATRRSEGQPNIFEEAPYNLTVLDVCSVVYSST